MRALSRKSRPQDSIPTSSMADIAFLLLVFFLVTTVFPKDKGLALVLPQEITEVSQDNVLHFLIAPTGTVVIRAGKSPHGRIVSTEDVAQIWQVAVAENPNLIAAVKTDPEAAYRYMIDVLDQLQSAGASRISLEILPR